MKWLKQTSFLLLFCSFFIVFTGASRKLAKKPRPLPLTNIHIVDRNGFAETISSKDRVSQFQNIDFLQPQPYQKVLLVYGRDSQGRIRSVATTYYENGNPKQFIEIINGRANGTYTEWHENGAPRLAACIIGGTPDLTSAAEKSWIFDGTSCVWDEDENLIAEISYDQGALFGVSTYYHPNGQIWKCIPYEKNRISGRVEVFKNNGDLLMQVNYLSGQKEGKALRFWKCNQIASEEEYCQNGLFEGQYYDQQQNLIAEVKEGTGYRATFAHWGLKELQEIHEGYMCGEVKVFNEKSQLTRVYHVKNSLKHGEEINYYPSGNGLKPHIIFHWQEGKIQGLVRTWYQNGNMESQKEMNNNKKNGVSTAWYKDGNLMMIEEYDENTLIRGEYYKKGERVPASQVIQGKGIVTMYGAAGNFIQKIPYLNGKPEPK